jgi:hypothetical protein
MDACDWRGDYYGWFALLTGAKFIGIGCREFVRWSVTDPQYAADARKIERMWKACAAKHGGAFGAALAARGIKLRRGGKPTDPSNPSRLFNEVPSGHQVPSGPTRDWRSRISAVLSTLSRGPSEPMLFWAACVVAEVMAETGKPKPGVARGLLEGACGGLRDELGREGVRRTIANGFRHVEEKVLATPPSAATTGELTDA